MPFNILLVDDSRISRNMIERTIGMAGVPVGQLFTAANGAEAIEILESNWIDLALIDINMPVMDGLTLVEKISDDPELSSVAIAVVSTEGSETKKKKLRELGVRAFVRKPFTPERIREVVLEMLGEWNEEE